MKKDTENRFENTMSFLVQISEELSLREDWNWDFLFQCESPQHWRILKGYLEDRDLLDDFLSDREPIGFSDFLDTREGLVALRKVILNKITNIIGENSNGEWIYLINEDLEFLFNCFSQEKRHEILFLLEGMGKIEFIKKNASGRPVVRSTEKEAFLSTEECPWDGSRRRVLDFIETRTFLKDRYSLLSKFIDKNLKKLKKEIALNKKQNLFDLEFIEVCRILEIPSFLVHPVLTLLEFQGRIFSGERRRTSIKYCLPEKAFDESYLVFQTQGISTHPNSSYLHFLEILCWMQAYSCGKWVNFEKYVNNLEEKEKTDDEHLMIHALFDLALYSDMNVSFEKIIQVEWEPCVDGFYSYSRMGERDLFQRPARVFLPEGPRLKRLFVSCYNQSFIRLALETNDKLKKYLDMLEASEKTPDSRPHIEHTEHGPSEGYFLNEWIKYRFENDLRMLTFKRPLPQEKIWELTKYLLPREVFLKNIDELNKFNFFKEEKEGEIFIKSIDLGFPQTW